MNDTASIKSYYCKNCPVNKNEDCGSWRYEHTPLFNNVKQIHQNHPGWQLGEPEIQINHLDNGINFITELFQSTEQKIKNRLKTKGLPIKQIESYLNSIIKNDKKLVGKILWCFISTYTNNPINLGIMAPSSEGKTYATVEVSKIFPKEDVISVGRMSPTALIHQKGVLVDENHNPIEKKLELLEYELENTEDPEFRKQVKKEKKELLQKSKNLIDLSGKIILFLESPHPKLWDMLKPILSHDSKEIEYKTTQTDGSLRVKESIIRGWPAVVFCSAKNEAHNRIWDEIETRFDITSPNTSATKYLEANRFTSLKMGIPSFADSMISDSEDEKYTKYYVRMIKKNLLQFSKRKPIWNPFHKIIADSFPNKEGISMRHFQRFIAYCNLSTLINSDNKFKIIFEKNNKKIESYLIADTDDIDNAIEMIGSLSVIPPEKIQFVHDVFEPALKETLDDGVTTQTLAKKYHQVYQKDTTAKKILESYIKPLYDYGVVDYKENLNDKRQHLNFLSSKPSENNLKNIQKKIIEQSYNDDLFVWHYILELEKSSIRNGKIKVILDPQGYPEGHNLIQKNIVKYDFESNNLELVIA